MKKIFAILLILLLFISFGCKNKEHFDYAKTSIKQKAIDVSKQIEIYINNNPEMTIEDLQNDEYFQSIAVQQVGKTGYTAVTDYRSLTCRFHKNPAIVDLDLHHLSEKLPGFWSVMSKTQGGHISEGIYKWEEADGSINKKYMYIALVNAETADGARLHVAATTHLHEYQRLDLPVPNMNKIAHAFLIIALFIIALSIYIYKAKKKPLENILIFGLLAITILLISGLFVYNSFNITQTMKQDAFNSYENLQKVLAEKAAKEIENDMKIILNDLETTTTEFDDPNLNTRTLLNNLNERLAYYIYSSYYLDENGILKERYLYEKIYASAPKSMLEKPGVKQTLASQESTITNLFQSNSGKTIFSVISPIISNQKTNGVLKSNIDVKQYMEKVFSPIAKEKTIPYVVVGDKSYDILANEALLAETQGIQKDHPDSSIQYTKIFSIDNSDSETLFVYHPVKILDKHWGVLIVSPLDNAFSPITNSLRSIWFNTLYLIISFIAIGTVFYFIITKSLRKQIVSKTSELQNLNKNLEKKVKERTKESDQKSEELKKLNINLEKKVKERTKELEDKNKELEKFNKLTIGREHRMIQMKEEIARLKQK